MQCVRKKQSILHHLYRSLCNNLILRNPLGLGYRLKIDMREIMKKCRYPCWTKLVRSGGGGEVGFWWLDSPCPAVSTYWVWFWFDWDFNSYFHVHIPDAIKPYMFLVSSYSWLCPIHWSEVLSDKVENEDVVGAAATGGASTTSEWSASLLPT